jgi:hypothetical protein
MFEVRKKFKNAVGSSNQRPENTQPLALIKKPLLGVASQTKEYFVFKG